jgi:hypothetical protein
MSISPFVVGQLLPILQVQLLQDPASVVGVVPSQPGPPVNLSGLGAGNFSMNIYNTVTKTDQPGNGYFIIVSAAQGQIQYVWDPADTANPGNFQLFISAVFSGRPLIFDPIPFTRVPK